MSEISDSGSEAVSLPKKFPIPFRDKMISEDISVSVGKKTCFFCRNLEMLLVNEDEVLEEEQVDHEDDAHLEMIEDGKPLFD
uniref:Uncharacterized protein n=1 Tax=Caenorhabditis japonica TaxID=281687 RepID=A0A8R1E3A5_CAEJA